MEISFQRMQRHILTIFCLTELRQNQTSKFRHKMPTLHTLNEKSVTWFQNEHVQVFHLLTFPT